MGAESENRTFPVLPPGFRFGTASGAYAVEGGWDADGRGPSIWDTFARQPGRIADGSTGAVAADSYHRWPEDVALLKRLGGGGHRFSISWSRVQPTGSGAWNQAGLDHYDRFLDALLEADVQPMVTLYHYDLPQALEDDGGWLNRTTIERYAEYAAVVGERYADRVEHWVPVSEPANAAYLGYGLGQQAPGKQLLFDSMAAAHHMLLAHGRGAMALRAAGATSVGCANNHSSIWPFSDDPADVGASKLFDAIWNGVFMESMLLGRYPIDLQPLMEEFTQDGDLATIRQPLDFYGLNYYSPQRVGATREDALLPFEWRPLLGYPVTDAGWSVVPDALREWLIVFRARFRAALPPIIITENGASYAIPPGPDGVVDDQVRIDYLDLYLRAIGQAVQRGVDVRGYYYWTLLDSFEAADGLSSRYGLVHVDPETQDRTPKRSFEWYAGLIAAQTRSVG